MTNNNFEQKFELNTAKEFLDFFTPWGGGAENMIGYVFRGHSNAEKYKLIPSVLRADTNEASWSLIGGRPAFDQWNFESWQIHLEKMLLSKFYRLSNHNGLTIPVSQKFKNLLSTEFDFEIMGSLNTDYWIDDDLLEVAALAQHYGVPTRLLDWTYDPLVAIYFASKSAKNEGGKIEIWAINKEYLSFLRPTENRVNVKFITPHYASNPNLNAQKGLFSHWPVLDISMAERMAQGPDYGPNFELTDRTPLDELIRNNIKPTDKMNIFKRITVPCTEAKKIFNMVQMMGYSSAKLFPGYDGIVKTMQDNRINHDDIA
ncbi:hypothetical protein SME04J_22600 [Serratia marcescens]|nr:hypothetical protein SME04J_22600 [Serratia marcescens]